MTEQLSFLRKSQIHNADDYISKYWIGMSVAIASGLIIALLVTTQVVVALFVPHAVPSNRHEYDLETLPSTYDAAIHPVRRVVFQTNYSEYSLNIIAVKLFNTSYMELYAQHSVALHVHTDNGITMSVPFSEVDTDSRSPYIQALLDLQEKYPDTYDATALYANGDSQNTRRLALRIGRFYMCIFCKGRLGCKASYRKRRMRGACTRLIAIGFDAHQ